jgi:WD repeat and SOF domain-containing protein 1
MRLKTISRSAEEETRARSTDPMRAPRNVDPALHPLEAQKEYKRAVNAAKMERMFAQPLLGALEGHMDGVMCLGTSPTSLAVLVSGAGDGELRVWDLPHRRTLWSVKGHTGAARGVSCVGTGEAFVSCGADRMVRLWDLSEAAGRAAGRVDTAALLHDFLRSDEDAGSGAAAAGGGGRRRRRRGEEEEEEEVEVGAGGARGGARGSSEPLMTWTASTPLLCIDHHRELDRFVTGGSSAQVWEHGRSAPLHSFEWGVDSVMSARWCPSERDVFVTTSSDRGVVLHDVRASTAVRKVVMRMNCNAAAWNPREPLNFAVGCEDHNAYTFDMRRLDKALVIHADHVGAVLDVSFAPTGRELLTGSYDRTIRIFAAAAGRSRDVYHTKRMQRVFSVAWSADAKYVLSGSDDTNIRVWKAKAAEKLGVLSSAERAKKDYSDALKQRFQHLPEVRRILRQRPMPVAIKKTTAKRNEMRLSRKRKLDNLIRNSKPGTVAVEPERKKPIVREEE